MPRHAVGHDEGALRPSKGPSRASQGRQWGHGRAIIMDSTTRDTPVMADEVGPISARLAKPFIERWHYSMRCPTGKNIFFGYLIDGVEHGLQTDLFGRGLYAVANYGIGVNPYQADALSRLTGLHIEADKLLELKRLCRVEPRLDNYPLTHFLSRCHRFLKQEGFCFVVSFSDPQHGHNGGIYKAANFQHLGKTNAEVHVSEQDGTVRHRRLYFRYARRHGISVKEARKDLRLESLKTPPKDRWFIQIARPLGGSEKG
jgi:hypothetical protein